MRIITGIYKGRHFDIPRSFKARPTTDFAKENIFNVLNSYIDFEGINALDLFSGTGSISLELVSRGCEHVVSVEMDRDHHRFIQECFHKLQGNNGQSSMLRSSSAGLQGKNVQCIRGDVFRYIKSCKQTAVRLYFCRSPLRPQGTAHHPWTDFREEPAEGWRYPGVRAW